MGAGAIAAGNDGGYHALIDPSRTWKNNRRLIALNGWIFLLLITSSTNGYDGSMMNALQSDTQWIAYFNNPHGSKLGLLNAIQNIGCLAAYPLAPYLSDNLGRRRTVILGATIMIVATALQTASQSIGMFIGARFLIGYGLTYAANAAPLLVTELSYPLYRAPLTSLYNSLWYSGAIVAAWSTFGTEFMNNSWSWRLPSLLQGLPSFAQVVLVWFMPESPRWLVSKGREAEALKTLAYYHADGNDQDPLVVYEFEEIRAAIEFDRTEGANVGWKSLITSPGNRKRLRIIIALAWFSQWSGNGLVSYYLGKVLDNIGITKHVDQLLVNGILQIWNLFWAVGASFSVDRVGRRALFLTSAAGMCMAFTIQTVCTERYLHSVEGGKAGNDSLAHTVIAFIFIFYAFYDLAFTPLIISYTVEILPYALRAKGFTVFNFVISCALIFNQYINPIALDHISWKYYIVYCVFLAFEFCYCYLFVVETRGLSLEETAALFDGEDVLQQRADHAMRHAQAGPTSPSDEKASAEFTEKV
ncbi:hexose transporter [Auriscalpium vulgare]|uniref:Hexose transporter n=1 Tax=Auriscalpium vulgare TaxID=40419 RepID=A0ACB8RZP1_9AGAM|nr:hexose transporter [Auriscalpium vulgare]